MSHFGNEPDPFEGVPDVDERICDWVDGTMPARDRERFEAELRVNPQLRQQVDEYEAMVAQQIAMVGKVNDHRVFVEPPLLQCIHHTANPIVNQRVVGIIIRFCKLSVILCEISSNRKFLW